MAEEVTQVNTDGTAEVVERQPFPGYYVVDGAKLTPDGQPWKPVRMEPAVKVAPEDEVPSKAPVVPAAKDPVTVKK
jgi:hypothetical protein